MAKGVRQTPISRRVKLTVTCLVASSQSPNFLQGLLAARGKFVELPDERRVQIVPFLLYSGRGSVTHSELLQTSFDTSFGLGPYVFIRIHVV